MNFKKHKSISWKTAFGVVVFLHLAVYGAITQYSSYKKRLTQELKDSREKLYNEKKSKPGWNNNHIIPKIVAVPVPQKQNTSSQPKIKKMVAESVKGVNNVLGSFEYIKNNFQIKKIDNCLPKEIKLATPKSSSHNVTFNTLVKNIPSKPTPITTPQPKPIQKLPVSLVKSTPTPQQKINQIPIIPEPLHQTKIRNIVIESNGTVVENTEETRQVISSRVVL